MFRKFTSRTYCVLPAILFLSLFISVLLSACSKKNEPEQPSGDQQPLMDAVIVLQTDSDEWQVQLFKEHLFYSEAVAVKLPAPWRLPDREEAKVLKKLLSELEQEDVHEEKVSYYLCRSSMEIPYLFKQRQPAQISGLPLSMYADKGYHGIAGGR